MKRKSSLSLFIILISLGVTSCSSDKSTESYLETSTYETEDDVQVEYTDDIYSSVYPNLIETISFKDPCSSSNRRKAIYGIDDRVSPCSKSLSYENTEQAKSVAMFIESRQLSYIGTKNGKKIYRIQASTLGNFIGRNYGVKACNSLNFKSEKAPGFCTGFLIDENNSNKELMTAGHCLKEKKNNKLKVVFTEPSNGKKAYSSKLPSEIFVSEEQIFDIKKRREFSEDFAIVELDRDVENVTPLTISRDEAMLEADPIQMIGHPAGLMLKFANGEVIEDLDNSSSINVRLDSFGGNSGSPVLNKRTGEVAGVLVSGQTDFELGYEYGYCIKDRVISPDNQTGEEVLKVRKFLN